MGSKQFLLQLRDIYYGFVFFFLIIKMKLIMSILHSAVSKKIPQPRGIKLCADSQIKLCECPQQKSIFIKASVLFYILSHYEKLCTCTSLILVLVFSNKFIINI